MNTQKELTENQEPKEESKPNMNVKELSRQYQCGELSSMDVLLAIRELLVRYN